MRFVVQKHNAKRAGLHYDFRLEGIITPGFFDSWVIPKLAVQQQMRLAIHVEPHSEECAYFEGVYGPGYGEGPVSIWDQGTYEILENIDGKIKVKLSGDRLNGVFSLNRKPDGNWLFIEKRIVPTGGFTDLYNAFKKK